MTVAAPGGRILVLRALGLGDLLTGVPALRGLRRAHPQHRIVLAAPAQLGPLVELTGAVDVLLPADGLEPLAWPGPPPELAVNLHGSGPQSHRLLAALRPGALWGFACPGFPDGPGFDPGEHEVARWCRLLTDRGVPADPSDLALPHPAAPSPAPGAVVLHPGAGFASKRWPADRFAAVAAGLAADGHRVVVTGSPAERRVAAEVAERAGLPDSAVLAGRTPLDVLAALAADAALVLCGDTGLGHLATAYGTPSVLVFGPYGAAAWGPPPGRAQHVVLGGVHHGTTHVGAVDPRLADAPDPALLAVRPADVLDTARRLLRERRPAV